MRPVFKVQTRNRSKRLIIGYQYGSQTKGVCSDHHVQGAEPFARALELHGQVRHTLAAADSAISIMPGSPCTRASSRHSFRDLNKLNRGVPPSDRIRLVHPEIKRLFTRGLSKSGIAKRLEIGRTSVRRILAQKDPGL